MTPRGETSALKTSPGTWGSPRFSPDGKRIALQVAYGSHEQIAVYDLASDRLTQLTFDAANHRAPIWTPDSQRLIYLSDASGAGSQNLYWRRADGSGEAERLTTSPGRQVPYGVHPSGRHVLYPETEGAAASVLWVLPLEGSAEKGWTAGTPRPLSKGGAFEGLTAFSPDGRLVVYMSNEQGAFAILCQTIRRRWWSVARLSGRWRASSLVQVRERVALHDRGPNHGGPVIGTTGRCSHRRRPGRGRPSVMPPLARSGSSTCTPTAPAPSSPALTPRAPLHMTRLFSC